MKKILPIILVFAILAVTACQKKDAVINKSSRELLVNKKWTIESNISIDSMNRETDLYAVQEPYKKDDYLLYNDDSTYQLNDNIILQSDTASKILDSGSWLLSEDNKQLFRHSDMYDRDYEPATITSLTVDKFTVETYFPSDRSTIRTSYKSIP